MKTNHAPSVVQPSQMERDRLNYRPLVTAGIVLGLAQGGFFDGIVFHQLLQWHHMFSSIETDMTVAGLELNTFGDGLFHIFNWVLSLTGIFLLWRAGQQQVSAWSGRALLGAIFMGFGLFNLVEGLIDHQILGIHHLKAGPNQLLWDMGFLASGALLIALGQFLINASKQNSMT